MTISKPTHGATGWDTATDAVIDAVNAGDDRKLNLSGGALTGALTLAADPTTNLQAATKQYVDNHTTGGSGAVTSVNGQTGAVTISTTSGTLPLFNVEDFGAVGDGVTDDYTAVKAAWDAMLTSSVGGLLYFPRAVEYRVNLGTAGRVAVGTGAQANSYAAFRLPDIAPTSAHPKRTFGVLGVGHPYAVREFPYQGGTAATTMTSAVLRVDYSTPFAWSATFGLPAVFGATDIDVNGLGAASALTNLHFVADKITIRQPDNPSLCGMNLEYCSTATIGEVAFDVFSTLDDIPEPTHPTGAALLMPKINNNIIAVIDKLLVVGHYAGAPVVEHIDMRSATVLRTKIAVPIRRNAFHFCHITMISIEQCPWGFAGYDPAGVGPNLGVVAIPGVILKAEFVDFEDYAYGLSGSTLAWMYAPLHGAHVWDPTGQLNGTINAARVDSEPSVGEGITSALWVGGGGSALTIHDFSGGNSTRHDASSHTPTNPVASAPNAPTIGTATAGDTSASVAFTAAVSGATATGFTATSTPGSHTGTGTSSPITVSGLTNGTAYTFTVHATNSVGDSAESSASNSVTPAAPNTPPNTPTIGTATAGDASASVAFTPAGTGPAATGYTATSTPGSHTGTGSSSPITVPGLTNGTGYTFTVHASNAAGNSAESSASNSVTPAAGPTTLAADTFTRADNGAGLGTAETGGAWTLSGTSWTIASDRAVATAVNTFYPAWLAVGATDVTVQADFDWTGGGLIDLGLIARVTDASNLLFLDISVSGSDLVGNIFRRAAGSFTALGTLFTIAAPAHGVHTIKLVCSGSSITAYFDGASVCTGTDTTETGTGAGFAVNGGIGTNNIIDNFSVTTP